MTTLGSLTSTPVTLPSEKRSPNAKRWAWAPAALLFSLIGTQVSVLAVVLDDPSFATEPDYYRKAVDWDAHMALARESRALGWSAHAHLDLAPADRERAPRLALALIGPGGEPLSGARVRVLAFPNAHASRSLPLALKESAAGQYQSDFNAHEPGLWELRVDAERGAEHYAATLRLEIGRAQ